MQWTWRARPEPASIPSAPPAAAAPRRPFLGPPWTVAQLGVFAVCVAVAFGARAELALRRGPLDFRPRPDVLEYVASAQAIAQEGKYYIQLGALRVRPRYSPGWPLILAGALRLGIPPQRLWIVAAGASSLVAGGLAWLTMSIVGRRRESMWPACVAGGLAGLAWAVGAVPRGSGSVALSDEPATLLAIASLAALDFAAPSRTRVASFLAAFTSGLAFALLAAVRAPQAALLAMPLLIVVYPGARSHPRLALAWMLGAGTVVAGVAGLLLRSGLNPLHWPAYAAWGAAPGLPSILRLEYIWGGVQARGAARHVDPHLPFALRTLLGVAADRAGRSVGSWWPAAGWMAVSIAIVRGVRSTVSLTRRLAAAVALWVATTVVFYSSYYFSAERFYLLLLALATCGLAGALGAGLGSSRRDVRHASMAAIAVAIMLQTQAEPLRRPPAALANPCRRTRAWLRLSDAERQGLRMPFDPVVAQAAGCLTSAEARSVKEWGILRNPRQKRPRPSALGELLVD